MTSSAEQRAGGDGGRRAWRSRQTLTRVAPSASRRLAQEERAGGQQQGDAENGADQ